MANESKPHRNPGSSKVFLQRKERIKVIACLDYSLEHKIDLTSVVAASLESLRGCEYAVVKVAANNALRNEYRNYGRSDGDDSFEAFLSEGSAFMRYGEKDTDVLQEARADIQEPAKRIMSQASPISHTISPNRVGGSDTSIVRSTNKTPEFENLGYPKKTPVRGSTTTPRPARSLRGRSTVSRTVAPSAEINEPLLAQYTRAVEIPETASPQTPNNHVREDRLSRLEKELAVRNEQLKMALQNIAEHKDYIFALSNRLSTAERECRKIKHSIEKATNLKDDITMQANLRYEYSVLRDQNIKMINQREVISLAANDSLRPNNQTIREEFELLLSDMKDASSSINILLPATADIEWDSHIEAWSYRLTGSGFGQLISHCLGNGVSEIHFMTALAAAGATELVFESSFPDFLTRASPMLDQYREHILSKGRHYHTHTPFVQGKDAELPSTAGPQTLSELDLLAYHSILFTSDNHDTNSNYFQSHVLTETATTLSKSLTDPLSHLISPLEEDTMTGCEVAQHTSFSGYFDPPASQDFNAAKEPESPLAATFTEHILRALKLKANLVLSLQTKYRLVFPHPGEIFDANTMIRNGESQMPKSTASKTRPIGPEGSGEKRVKLCLFPGLYERKQEVLPESEYGLGVNERNCLVDSDNFVKASEGVEMEGFGVVVKAVVLLWSQE